MKYRLSCNFAEMQKDEVLSDEGRQPGYYAMFNGNGYHTIHIDIIRKLPEIFVPVPEKKKVWIAVDNEIMTDNIGGFLTSRAFPTLGICEARTNPNFQIIETEIEVKE